MIPQPAERTLICTVVFADLVAQTLRTMEQQKALKQRFTEAVAAAVHGIPVAERVIVDTGDGAAVAFTVDPEDALHTAMHLREAFGELLRVGINLGPVQLVRDVNGQSNVLGDGINAANRVMGFAQPGQVVVSRACRDAVATIAKEYDGLFTFAGKRTDKHVREHEVYVMGDSAPAAQRAREANARRASAAKEPSRAVRAVIAEDEPVLRDELVELLAKVWPELEIAAVAADGLAALRAVDLHKPDIVFLDIQMPGLTGIEVARTVGERAHVVFLTANDGFAISAFEEGAVDYVLKPYSTARLYTACRRVRQRLGT